MDKTGIGAMLSWARAPAQALGGRGTEIGAASKSQQ